jgi:hypothetical protein
VSSRDARGVERAVGHAGGQHDRVRGDLAAVAEPHTRAEPRDLQRDDVAGGEHLGAELRGLPAGPVGELGAGHAVGEAEVVLDPRALPGLPAGGLRSTSTVRRPSDAPYTAAPSPAGRRRRRRGRRSRVAGSVVSPTPRRSRVVGAPAPSPSGVTPRDVVRRRARGVQQPRALRLVDVYQR